MNYINTETLEYPVSYSELLYRFRNTSFPQVFVAPAPYKEVGESTQPEFDTRIQSLHEEAPASINGSWVRQWSVVEMYSTQEQKDAAIAAAVEAVRVASVPLQVSMRQTCLALEGASLLDDVEALVATLPRLYQIEWQRASVVFRNNPLVELVRVQKGMTDREIDDLFTLAVTL